MDAMDLDIEMDVDFVADEPITATQPQDTPVSTKSWCTLAVFRILTKMCI